MSVETIEAPQPSQTATTAPAKPKREAKPRKKRSWTSVNFKWGEDRWKFWLTPAGLHARKHRSRRVWEIKDVPELVDFVTGQKHLPLV